MSHSHGERSYCPVCGHEAISTMVPCENCGYPEKEPKIGKWLGTPPKRCDICERDLDNYDWWVDGRLAGTTTWANMCPGCWPAEGVQKLGTGCGQKYDRKTLRKIEG